MALGHEVIARLLVERILAGRYSEKRPRGFTAQCSARNRRPLLRGSQAWFAKLRNKDDPVRSVYEIRDFKSVIIYVEL